MRGTVGRLFCETDSGFELLLQPPTSRSADGYLIGRVGNRDKSTAIGTATDEGETVEIDNVAPVYPSERGGSEDFVDLGNGQWRKPCRFTVEQ